MTARKKRMQNVNIFLHPELSYVIMNSFKSRKKIPRDVSKVTGEAIRFVFLLFLCGRRETICMM